LKYIDIHTHAPWRSDVIQIRDFSDRAKEPDNKRYFSAGLHPWFIRNAGLKEDLYKLEKHLQHPNCIAIGECGLDKLSKIDFSLQIRVFKEQIRLSEKYQKPLILHVVKAFNELIEIRKEMHVKQTWIVHGFNGSVQLANQLLAVNMFLSFGFRLQDPSSKATKALRNIPLNRVFFETDVSDIAIEEIYNHASLCLGADLKTIENQLYANLEHVFPLL